MGIDVEGVFPPQHHVRLSRTTNWKPWRMPYGLEVLVSERLQDHRRRQRRHRSSIPRATPRPRPAAGCPTAATSSTPSSGRSRSTRTSSTREDNLEEFEPDLRRGPGALRREARTRPRATGRAVIATFGGTAFGDIALVPAPFLKHPKGIRDVAEWYMSTGSAARLRARDLRAAVRDRAGQPGADPRRGGRRGRRGLRLRHRFRHADLGLLLGRDVPRAVLPVLQAGQRLDPRAHARGRPSSTPAARWSSSSRRSSRPASTSSTRCSARPRAWSRST